MNNLLKSHRKHLLISFALLLLWGIFAAASPGTFSNPRIYRSFMSTIPVTLLLALGMTLLVTLGEMDLSFPSVSAVSAYIFASLYAHMGIPAPVALFAALATGLLLGWFNGLLVVLVGIPSIIATIGTQFLWRGLVLLLADGLAISLAPLREETLHFLLVGRIAGGYLPLQALWSVGIALFLGFLLNRHPLGDAILFIGDNRDTAEMMGIPVKRVRIAVFMLMGLLAAFAGVLATFELNNWWPTQGEGYMLMVFASVFVGGTSAYGGEGTIYGSFVGAIIIGIIEAGIVSTGLVGFWTRFVHGFVIILSVSIYALLARKKRA